MFSNQKSNVCLTIPEAISIVLASSPDRCSAASVKRLRIDSASSSYSNGLSRPNFIGLICNNVAVISCRTKCFGFIDSIIDHRKPRVQAEYLPNMKTKRYEAIYKMLIERFGEPIGDGQGVPTSNRKKE